jgi:WD40 repeat protein
VTFSQDSRRLLTGGREGKVRAWSLDNLGADPDVVAAQGGEISALATDAESSRLATGGGGALRIWDLSRRGPSPLAIQARGSIRSLAFSRDGRWLAGASANGNLLLWDARPWRYTLKEVIRRAGQAAGRNLTLPEWQQYFPGQRYRPTFLDQPLPAYDPEFEAIVKNLTRSEWEQYFPGEAYRKTFPDLPDAPDVK